MKEERTMKTQPTTWLNPEIQIMTSPIHGKGMFACSPIEKGETLVVWGDGYTDRAGALKTKRQGKGIMQWDDDIFSIENNENREAYSINHSCDPNCWMMDSYTIGARRDIQAGEEITADYALWEANEELRSPWECNCGSPLCRGKVTGGDWKSGELQKRYHGHFSPLINKRILKLKRI